MVNQFSGDVLKFFGKVQCLLVAERSTRQIVGDTDKLYEEGLRCYNKCFQHMKEHWSDFNSTDTQRRNQWKNLLLQFKHKILTMRLGEMRSEIQALWASGYMSEEAKGEWAAFQGDAESADAAEQKLSRMREELARIREYHDTHRDLIRLVKKYEEAENSLNVVAQESFGHNRLTNRGALLLKEEQQRSLLTKVPQMQKMILKMIKEKETKGETFLIRGEHFQTIVDRNKKTLQMKSRYKQSMSLQRTGCRGGVGGGGGGGGGGGVGEGPGGGGGGGRPDPTHSACPHNSRRLQECPNRTSSSLSVSRRGYASN